MELFSLLLSDPVVASGVAVIVGTSLVIGYIAFYFIRNIMKSPKKT